MQQQYLCPVDQTALVMSERQGVEIDYCPTCRGVWLDRGELDKILEKSAGQPAPAAPLNQAAPWAGEPPRHGHHGYKRRKSFLQELFD